MASELTGDYDVVAAFSLGAVNRILAAMHRGKRLPHSMSLAVDDFPDLKLGIAAVIITNPRNEALTDAVRVKQVAYAKRSPKTLSPQLIREIDPVVNWRPAPAAAAPPALPQNPLEPATSISGRSMAEIIGGIEISDYFSNLSGVAQLQLGPPTMELQRGSSDRADIHTPVMIRYHADENTRDLAPHMRGEIVTSFGVKRVSTPSGPNVIVDVAGPVGKIHFNPAWTSNSLSANDQAAIDTALAKTLKHSFQPSSTKLPDGVKRADFRGFPSQQAVAILMNTSTSGGANPASVGSAALRVQDHFSLTVSPDLITSPLADAVNGSIKSPPRTDTTVQIDYLIGTWTFHIYTSVYVLPATVEIVDIPLFSVADGKGEILLKVPVQVRFGWKDKPSVAPSPVDFDFTILQAFTLSLNGRNVGFERVGSLVVDIPSWVPANQANPARTQATNLFNQAWNANANQIRTKINEALKADILQNFVASLMNPPHTGSTPVENVTPDLNYTYFELSPGGIILYGSLAVPRWPNPEVIFDQDLWAPAATPEYRALNSWIPGGTITEYQWNFPQAGTLTDANRFVTTNAPALMAHSNRICLTFTGTRITSVGPVLYETVHSTRSCKWTSLPIAVAIRPGLKIGALVAVPKPGPPQPAPGLNVIAHASPWAPEGLAGATANFLIHFPDHRSIEQLELLPRALAQSGREEATGILCVLSRDQLSSVRVEPDLMYADDAGPWERMFNVQSRPFTVLLNPDGELAWRQEGPINSDALAEALRQRLSSSGKFFPQFRESPLRVGDPTPNFIFDIEKDERTTLRKLGGRSIVLVFWTSASAASVDVLRNLQRAFNPRGADAPIIIAISDGEEDGEFARGLAAGDDGDVLVVPDPGRSISHAYGVTMWPTTILLDADGLLRDVRVGLLTAEDLQAVIGSKNPEPATSSKEPEGGKGEAAL